MAFLGWLVRRGKPFQTLFAAALVSVMILPWALLAPEVSRLSGEQERLTGELSEALLPQIQTQTYFLSPERSGPTEEPSTRISLRSTPEWVSLTLQLPPFPNPIGLPKSADGIGEGQDPGTWEADEEGGGEG